MKKEDITNKAKKAIELVSGVDDEFKIAAFSVVFDKILDHGDEPQPPQQKRSGHSEPRHDSGVPDIQGKKGELAEKCSISVTQLDEILYFDSDIIKVIAPLSGSEPEKQLTVAKCILTAYDVIFGQPWVKALVLSKCVGASKVGQLSHLSKNLKKDKQSIRLQGSRKGVEYKITEYGKALTFDIIKKLAKGEAL
ncbi:MAG: hypothetical protein QXE82_05190 [Candidatus Nitrosotenuis sp.]